ncbi:pepsin A [Drosophila willistoni]|nr:pepsin A [Drosophila willistoni]
MNLRVVFVLLFCATYATAKLHHFSMIKRKHKHSKPLHRRVHKRHQNALKAKYGLSTISKVNAVTNSGSSTSAASSGIQQTSSLENYYDAEFLVTITLGEQSFIVVPDTGSADMWVPDASCNFCANSCQNHIFNRAKSKSFVNNGTSFSITYGSGSAAGTTGSDTFKIGKMTVQNQTFGLANTISSCSAYDGIWGLGFPSLSQLKTEPPFQNLITQNQVEKSIFSFSLKTNTMIMGGSNSSLYYGELIYTPVTVASYWQFNLQTIDFSDGSCPRCSGNCTAIMDTGTSLIVGPSSDIMALNTQLGATFNSTYDLWLVECAIISTLPQLVLTIANTKFYIKPETYVLNLGTVCASGLMDLSGITFWIIGDVFLRQHYVEFDSTKQQMGIAPALG